MMKKAASLHLRITVLLIAAILLTLGTATMVIDFRVDDEVAQRADNNLLERAQALADVFAARHNGSSTPLDAFKMPSFLSDDGVVYYRIGCDGQQVASSSVANTLAWPAPSADKKVMFADMADRNGVELRAVTLRFSSGMPATGYAGDLKHAAPHNAYGADTACALGLAVDRREVLDFQESMDRIEFGCVILGFLVVAVLTPILVTRGLRPLIGLADAMDSIGPESPGVRLGDAHVRELSPLVTRFNEVLSRMEEGLMRERQFASGVAHELRTPLTELRTAIEVELRYPSGKDLRALLADIGDIGKEMQSIVAALLMLTRIEAGLEVAQVERIDMVVLTKRLVDRYGARIRERNLSVREEISSEVIWHADAALLDVALSNLLSNAVAYAPTGSQILLRCVANNWSVVNEAPNLTAEDVKLMRQRFWRKGRDAGVHTGLGLVLADAALNALSMKLHMMVESGSFHASISPPV